MADATDALDRYLDRAPLPALAALAIAAELALARRAHAWANTLTALDGTLSGAFRWIAEQADWRRRGLARELGALAGPTPPSVAPFWVEALLSPAWAGAPLGARGSPARPEGAAALDRAAAVHARDTWLRAGERARDTARQRLCRRLADVADTRLRPESHHLVPGQPVRRAARSAPAT
jgi:hypothetical protein